MEQIELSLEQCRVLARIRAGHPEALIALHRSRGGVIVEVRHGRRSALARLAPCGTVSQDRPLRLAS